MNVESMTWCWFEAGGARSNKARVRVLPFFSHIGVSGWGKWPTMASGRDSHVGDTIAGVTVFLFFNSKTLDV
jgi:hypothetical protein